MLIDINVNERVKATHSEVFVDGANLIGTAKKVYSPSPSKIWDIWATVGFDGFFLGFYGTAAIARVACENYFAEGKVNHEMNISDASKE